MKPGVYRSQRKPFEGTDIGMSPDISLSPEHSFSQEELIYFGGNKVTGPKDAVTGDSMRGSYWELTPLERSVSTKYSAGFPAGFNRVPREELSDILAQREGQIHTTILQQIMEAYKQE